MPTVFVLAVTEFEMPLYTLEDAEEIVIVGREFWAAPAIEFIRTRKTSVEPLDVKLCEPEPVSIDMVPVNVPVANIFPLLDKSKSQTISAAVPPNLL